VVVISGDGDLFSIGGNHFIHAARRNIDITVICSNNFNYGMTGGQAGPTTMLDGRTTTSPYGNIEHPFNLVHLAAGSGAVYVSRWTTAHVRRIRESIKKALTKKGFTFIEVITPCPEQYGRRNRMGEIMDYSERRMRAAISKMPKASSRLLTTWRMSPREDLLRFESESPSTMVESASIIQGHAHRLRHQSTHHLE
jgi:pyruvate/2-oxoacid:ferredoxin oxidoreductase beta subunit